MSASSRGVAPPTCWSVHMQVHVLLLLLLFAAAGFSQALASSDCEYLSVDPLSIEEGGRPLQRDVQAALNGTAKEMVVGALGIKGSENLFTQWNSTFATYGPYNPAAQIVQCPRGPAGLSQLYLLSVISLCPSSPTHQPLSPLHLTTWRSNGADILRTTLACG